MIEILFDTSQFLTRNECGHWHPAFTQIYWMSAMASFAAFMAIPLILWRFHIAWKRAVQSLLVRRLFAAFILACGFTRLEAVLAFCWPAYHLFALVHSLTATLAWATIIALIHVNQDNDPSRYS